MLNRSPHCGIIIFDPVVAFVSPNVGGWMNAFFVEVLMTGSPWDHIPTASQWQDKKPHQSLHLLTSMPSTSIWWLDFLEEFSLCCFFNLVLMVWESTQTWDAHFSSYNALKIETCVHNISVRSHFSDLNIDELTLLHQLFNSGYDCGSTKSIVRSSLRLKLNLIVGRWHGHRI